LLLRRELYEGQSLFPTILDHVETAPQRQLLAQMAAEPLVIEGQESRKALRDYLSRFRRRNIQDQLRRLRERLQEAERRGDAAMQQRLLQECTALSREKNHGSNEVCCDTG
jgi:hypothetical protein